MAVKDIMAELHRAVFDRYMTGIKYHHAVCKPMEKANLSEIAVYRLVAEHCEENDIKPDKMSRDVITLFEELPRNVFFVKTSDKFYYLRKAINELKANEFDAKQFICNNCHYVKKAWERKQNGKICKTCAKELQNSVNKSARERKQDEAREKRQQERNQRPSFELEPKELQTVNPTASAPLNDKRQAPQSLEIIVDTQKETERRDRVHHNINNPDPFIRISDLMTDPDAGEVTVLVTSNMFELKKLLEIIDPYLIRETKKGDQNDAEKEPG